MKLFSRMLPSNRQEAVRWQRWRVIFDILEDKQVSSIGELMQATGERRSIIEQDIAELAKQGLIVRTAKDGIALQDFEPEKPLEARRSVDPEAKSRLARLAAQRFITEGMTVFLDASTTVAAIAPFIANKRIKVVTNGLNLIAALREYRFPGELVCTGGTVRMKSNSLIGEETLHVYDSIKADLAVLSINVISQKMDLMEGHPMEAIVKRHMIQAAARTVILALPHKFGDASLLRVATLNDVDALVSTEFPDPEFLAAAKATSTQLLCPNDAPY